jgi:zinc transport system substrate-binding protein
MAIGGGLATAQPRLPVIVTILPHAGLADRLGGELLQVEVLVGPGQSPHTFDPTPRQLADVSDARVWFRAGVAMERSLADRLTRLVPDLEVVDLSAGLMTRAGSDHAGEPDPHVWLSPHLYAEQARAMAAALIALDASHADVYRRNLAAVQDSLAAVDRDLTAMLAPVRGHTLYVFHPAFSYFCHDYGLQESAIESGGVDPGPRALAAILADIARTGARVIFVEPQFASSAAAAIARLAGLGTVTLDPLARDNITNLRRLGRAIARALAEVQP